MKTASFNNSYSASRIKVSKPVTDALLITFILIVSIFFPFLKPVLFIGLFLYCLAGPEGVIKALTLSWLITMATPAFGDTSSIISLLKPLLSICAICTLTAHWTFKNKLFPPATVAWILSFSMLLLLFSVISSYAVDISILKIVVFAASLVPVFWAMKYAVRHCNLYAWFSTLFLCILFMSVVFIPTAQGYFRNDSGFQGVFNHPQVMGAFAGIAVAWLFAKVVMYRKVTALYVIAFLLAASMLYLSEARVGLATAVIAILAAFFSRSGGKAKLRTVIFVYAFLSLVFIASMAFDVAGHAETFISKRAGHELTTAEAIVASRLHLIENSFTNFLNHPYIGIGFGVPTNPADLVVQYDPIFGLPVSASIEKGVFFVAILEETGVFGTIAFLFLLGAFFKKIYEAGNAELIALFIAPIATNLGDATLFSMGGNGLFMWLMMAYAYYAASNLIETRKPKSR